MARSHSPQIARFRALIALLSGATLLLTLGGCAQNTAGPEPTSEIVASAKVEPIERVWPQRIRVSLMGDMLPHDSVNANAKTGGSYDYQKYFSQIRQIWSTSELVYCNQEAPSAPSVKVTGYPLFNAPAKFAEDLHAAGCNAVNLANNHSVDRGQAAAVATRELWNGINPLLLTGVNRSAEEQRKVSYTEIDGVRFALLGYTMLSNQGFADWNLNHTRNDALVRAQMAEARANADIVLVSMHWGVEDTNTPNNTQRNYAKYLSGLGADVIIGMHPHVVQPVEWLQRSDGKQTLVWYSLGNMLSSQLTLAQRVSGVGMFDVLVEGESIRVVDPQFVPTFMYYYWTPAQQSAGNLLARKDLMLYLLWDAQKYLDLARFNTTVEKQYAYLHKALGSAVSIYRPESR
ncbi:MAG: CapA family protein [Microbacteriaceae bacterium]